MAKDLIFTFISDRLKSVERNLSNFKILHSLRVDIKKIEAIASFIYDIHKHFIRIKSLKKIFKKAGKIRDLQLHISLLSQLQNPPTDFIIQLNKKEIQIENRFIIKIPTYILLVNKFRKHTSFSFPLSEKKLLRKHLTKKRKNAINCIKNNTRENMHAFRNKIKKLEYIYSILPKKTKPGLNKVLLDKIMKEIGNWHDTYTTNMLGQYFAV